MLSAGRPVSAGVIATSEVQVSSAQRRRVARSTPAGRADERAAAAGRPWGGWARGGGGCWGKAWGGRDEGGAAGRSRQPGHHRTSSDDGKCLAHGCGSFRELFRASGGRRGSTWKASAGRR